MHSQTHPPIHPRTYFPPLTSLRFFAAFFIFLLHSSNHSLLPSVSQFIDLSQAVTFFFVLSGLSFPTLISIRKSLLLLFCITAGAHLADYGSFNPICCLIYSLSSLPSSSRQRILSLL